MLENLKTKTSVAALVAALAITGPVFGQGINADADVNVNVGNGDGIGADADVSANVGGAADADVSAGANVGGSNGSDVDADVDVSIPGGDDSEGGSGEAGGGADGTGGGADGIDGVGADASVARANSTSLSACSSVPAEVGANGASASSIINADYASIVEVTGCANVASAEDLAPAIGAVAQNEALVAELNSQGYTISDVIGVATASEDAISVYVDAE